MKLRATLLVAALFTTGLAGGTWVGARAAERAAQPYEHLETLVTVLSRVEQAYVDEIPLRDLTAAAIDGVLQRLDPHSTWLSAEEYGDLRRSTEGEYTGIGVEVRRDGSGVRVTRVLPGSPAYRDGMREGDVILTVDGQSVQGQPLDAVSQFLTGEVGAETKLEVQREDAIELITTRRDVVKSPAVEAGRLSPGFGYLRIRVFQRGTIEEVQEALRQLRARGALQGLVLDVRDNPGGLLDEAVSVADLFLDAGAIVSTWGRLDSEQRVHEATSGALDIPLVLLVNGGSASASEILAGALQDTARATLIGTPTYGKGSIQSLFEQRDGSVLKLTIGRYYTPSGEPVAPRDGRTPDIIVDPAPVDGPWELLHQRLASNTTLSATERQQMLGLLDAIPRPDVIRRDVPWNGTMAERLDADPQLSEALNVLQTR